MTGLISLIRGFQDRAHAADVNDAMQGNGDPTQNYLNNPQAAVKAVFDVDPNQGLALQDKYQAQQAQQQAQQQTAAQAAQTQAESQFKQFGGLLRAGYEADPQHFDAAGAIEAARPIAKSAWGMTDDHVDQMKAAVARDPTILRGFDPEYQKTADANLKDYTLAPGAQRYSGGVNPTLVAAAPAERKAVAVPAGGMAASFDPNTGGFATTAAAPQVGQPAGGALPKVPAAQLLPVIKQKESGGDYTAVSPQGALGAYGIMPDTGRVLAARAGVAWRPDLMTSNDPAAQKYQDAIGGAAAQEAVDKTGNVADALRYYHGGSNRAVWGPKTQAYAADGLSRLGIQGGAQPAAPAAPGVLMGPPKVPAAGKGGWETLPPDQVKTLGLPDGTVAQRNASGQIKVISKPTAQQQSATAGDAASRQSTLSMFDDMDHTLDQLDKDPNLNSHLGAMGAVTNLLPGSHGRYIKGQIDKINSEKLTSLLSNLKANGNPLGNRILKVEVEQLPKTLANLDMDQNPTDFHANIATARQQIARMRSATQGYYQTQSGPQAAPKPGTVMDGHVFLGGDPSQARNWRPQ